MPLYHKTKVLISKKAIDKNIKAFRGLIGKKVKLMAVVKSNAYGHGLVTYTTYAKKKIDWFGVDSMAEARALRFAGIRNPILVLGYTIPSLYKEAAEQKISLSFFNAVERKFLLKHPKLKIHLKIDTGMHRQGIYPDELASFIKDINASQIEGVYTHFSGAKDPKFKPYTLMQIENFKKAINIVSKKNPKVIRHAAATSSTVHYSNSYFDMVRVGAGVYGLGLSKDSPINTEPILSWTSIIAQVKKVKKNSFIGYDLTEKVSHESFVAVVPIGYWHGVARNLSRIGPVLVGGKRAKILGIVSMDAIVISIPRGLKVKPGDEVVLIGKQGSKRITVREIGKLRKTVDSEVVTTINPLIPRVLY